MAAEPFLISPPSQGELNKTIPCILSHCYFNCIAQTVKYCNPFHTRIHTHKDTHRQSYTVLLCAAACLPVSDRFGGACKHWLVFTLGKVYSQVVEKKDGFVL